MHTLKTLGLAAAFASIFASGGALAVAKVGAAAPDFKAVDSNGKSHQLSELKGKTVVLEWTNDGCPFVQKHYGSKNMQGLQKAAAADGVVWLTVISSAPGKQGHLKGSQANEQTKKYGAAPAAVLLDEQGTVGQMYEAQTTPHMFIVDGSGTLVYAGGIDDTPTADPADIPKSKNFVASALAEMKAGKPVSNALTKPYGCSVKY